MKLDEHNRFAEQVSPVTVSDINCPKCLAWDEQLVTRSSAQTQITRRGLHTRLHWCRRCGFESDVVIAELANQTENQR